MAGGQFNGNGRPIEILMVEDNPGDARLAVEALKESKVSNRLNVVEDGVEALAYLRRQGDYSDRQRPDVVFLDLNLPRKSGHEVLAEIKEDESLRQIPVVILSSSEAEKDIFKSYDLHANCFVTKPVDLEQFLHVVKMIEGFWLTIVKLPPGENHE